MNILSARRYVSTRKCALTPDEAETRRIAYALKLPAGADEDFKRAGAELAALVNSPCVLVPVPDCRGGTVVNCRLCQAIADNLGPACRVKDCLYRVTPIQSQCERHRARLGPLPAAAHGIRRYKNAMFDVSIPVYCVDNVVTSGNTLAACRMVISTARGLVFADAYSTWQK